MFWLHFVLNLSQSIFDWKSWTWLTIRFIIKPIRKSSIHGETYTLLSLRLTFSFHRPGRRVMWWRRLFYNKDLWVCVWGYFWRWCTCQTSAVDTRSWLTAWLVVVVWRKRMGRIAHLMNEWIYVVVMPEPYKWFNTRCNLEDVLFTVDATPTNALEVSAVHQTPAPSI